MGDKDTVLATFTIEHDGSPHSGYVTTMFDDTGTEVDDPRKAVEFVGYIQEGRHAGKWLRWSAHKDDQWRRIKFS